MSRVAGEVELGLLQKQHRRRANREVLKLKQDTQEHTHSDSESLDPLCEEARQHLKELKTKREGAVMLSDSR